ncbi:S9 family peptidase [Dysgonomonas sp. 216]|uniref:S9 family peptidase n=1 Tax=Dysgonomonas sp. 216 TaxID=2302934 RepID=UPI0013D10A6E|nr:S9 family peptidase [Dysgonomonas sp. 216]NDW18506.1 S9 family peptidase [Dysgonomonas sp. 216]
MKRNIVLLIIAVFVSVNIFGQSTLLKNITSGKYKPSESIDLISSADGEYYFKATDANSKIVKYSYKTGEEVETVFDAKKARECPFDKFEGFLMSPDEKRLLIYINSERIYRHSFKADYYYYDIRRNHVRKLTENKSKQMVPVFSKNGRMLAYVADNDIWLAKFDFETESQITKDGEARKIINGATDWVYEEEFGVTYLMDFSHDNRLLAFVRFDESDVSEFSFQFFEGQLYPSLFSFKYPKAGEKNSKVSCNVFDIESKTIRKVDIPEAETEYIPKIEFVDDVQLAVVTLNRDQNNFNLYFSNTRSTVSKLILNEKNERYVNFVLLSTIFFLPDQFIYLSEKDGYSHIYNYSNTGVLRKQLTTGKYDVTALLSVDPENKVVYYESAEESPLKRAIYRVDIEKGNKTKLSAQTGTNTARFSNGGKYFINQWSDANTPSVISVHEAKGKQLRIIDDNKNLRDELTKLNLPKKEFITVKAADGTDLNTYVIKPANFDASRKYPLVMLQYSGPDSQLVLDRFSADWELYLASQGFVVACVDGRGTGARGEDFRKCTYMNMGIIESDDQIAAARYFASLSYIDANRIGIWGWSYGGYNALLCMSRSDVFKAGVAIAPVTDWRFYDSVYTERFMRTPQQNMAGYEKGSPINYASSLTGNLLLIHGSADDNVHYQNTMEYAKALVNANKHFDMFTFTDKEHSILGAQSREYLYTKVVNFFSKNM